MKAKPVLAGVILSVSAFVITPPAAASFSQCNSGNVCLWGNNDFDWLLAERLGGSTSVWNLSNADNNRMDSWGNRSTFSGCGYGGFNGSGDKQTFGAGQRDDNVAPWNSDEVSSWKTRYGC